jgi:molybdopterin/thiamine biosynthesis adenylyltransferase
MNTRYARQIILPSVGAEGQKRLAAARVLVVGAGGLGSPALLYLAGAGVGHIRLLDPDRVSLSNLHRQVMFETADIGRLKVEAARDRLQELNPEVAVEAHAEAITAENASSWVEGMDVVMDGSDQLDCRHHLNRAALAQKIPMIFAALGQSHGQLGVFAPHAGKDQPCFACFCPEGIEANWLRCEEAGVFGPLAGVMGSLQAMEALKLLLGIEDTVLMGQLLRVDLISHRQQIARIARDPACPVCRQ